MPTERPGNRFDDAAFEAPVVSENEAMGCLQQKTRPALFARVGFDCSFPTALATFVTRLQAGSNRRGMRILYRYMTAR
jgi:hypothetical protein